MSTTGLPTIWELVAEGAATLPEPFSRAALLNWVSARRPDVGVSSIAAHIPRPAARLFESPGFAHARERAVRSGLPWFVLSAKHGLLDADDVIGPYDVELGDRSAGYRNAWAEWVVAQLGDRVALAGATVEVHGGVDFVQPLRRPLAARGAAVELPLPQTWQDTDLPAVGEEAPMSTALGRI